MPIVTVKILEGRSDEQKSALVSKVTEAVSETIDAAPERISVVIEEMKKTNYGVAGKRMSDI